MAHVTRVNKGPYSNLGGLLRNVCRQNQPYIHSFTMSVLWLRICFGSAPFTSPISSAVRIRSGGHPGRSNELIRGISHPSAVFLLNYFFMFQSRVRASTVTCDGSLYTFELHKAQAGMRSRQLRRKNIPSSSNVRKFLERLILRPILSAYHFFFSLVSGACGIVDPRSHYRAAVGGLWCTRRSPHLLAFRRWNLIFHIKFRRINRHRKPQGAGVQPAAVCEPIFKSAGLN